MNVVTVTNSTKTIGTENLRQKVTQATTKTGKECCRNMDNFNGQTYSAPAEWRYSADSNYRAHLECWSPRVEATFRLFPTHCHRQQRWTTSPFHCCYHWLRTLCTDSLQQKIQIASAKGNGKKVNRHREMESRCRNTSPVSSAHAVPGA